MLVGTALMALFVATSFCVVARQAGAWGVPYFSFTSAHGSRCTNGWVGYACTPLTLADVEFFGDVDLPATTAVVASRYHATHDFELEAQLEVPTTASAEAAKQLTDAYGPCRRDARSPLPTAGLQQVCVIASGDGADESGEQPSRMVNVGTGIRKDGVRVIGLAVSSR